MPVGSIVSVLICSYTEERWPALVAAVESVGAQTAPPSEIVVVVDHNSGLLDRVRSELSTVTATENKEERGAAGSRNSGVAVARGSIIACLDDDAVADPRWLEQLLPHFVDNRVLGVGGPIGSIWEAPRPSWFPEEFDWVVGCTYPGLPTQPAPVRNLIGCNMAFRRDVFDAIGGFRGNLGRVGKVPISSEETEFCIRALQHWPERHWLYEPLARVAQRVPASRACWRYFRSRCYDEGRSKALMTTYVGSAQGLASEREYTLRTLPRGMARHALNAIVRRDKAEGARAVLIPVGLLITATGYAKGKLTARRSRGSGSPSLTRGTSAQA